METIGERLALWPFRHDELLGELRDLELAVEQTTYEPAVERYLVTARRPGTGSAAGGNMHQQR